MLNNVGVQNQSSQILTTAKSFEALLEQVTPEIRRVSHHLAFASLRSPEALKKFMQSHVFAVWDFMSLLKSLQQKLTCTTVPWVPPENMDACRLVNDIVLAEESDEICTGSYASHFDLYLSAMGEVGAETSQIHKFILFLRKGASVENALEQIEISEAVKDFVKTTMDISKLQSHEVASAFLFGREHVIPKMFASVIQQIDQEDGLSCHLFQMYLDRHILLDGDHHGPMARKLLESLCGDDPIKWQEATEAAIRSLDARRSLWDSLITS